MEKRQFVIILVSLAILVGSVVLAGMLKGMKKKPEKKPIEKVKKYVKTTSVKYDDIPTLITTYGRIKTAESLDLIAKVSGTMSNGVVLLKEGQSFRKGTLLYKIDDVEMLINLKSKKSDFLKQLALILPEIKIDYSDSFEKWNAYFSSINIEKILPKIPQFDSDKEKIFLSTKNIYSAYYTIKSLEVTLRKHRFYAPFDGVISKVNLQSGSFVNPGNNIATILRTDKLELKVEVPLSDVEWITKGTRVKIETEFGKVTTGIVSRIGEFVNQNTQSIDVFISLDVRKDVRIYDGEYLKSLIPGRNIKNSMEIPRNAVFEKNKVFVLQDTVLKVKEIFVQKINPKTIIFTGLEENSELVTEPLINAHNNMIAYKLTKAMTEKKDAKNKNKEINKLKR